MDTSSAQPVNANAEWHRPLTSQSGAEATWSAIGGAKKWSAITVVVATREPTQMLPIHFIKSVIRSVQLSTVSLQDDRNDIAQSDDSDHVFDVFHPSEGPVNTEERTHQYRCAGDL